VLTYRTSGIFNFAHGAIAAASAFLFYEMREQWHVPWPIAAIICLAVFAPLVGLVLERLAYRLTGATTASKIVATIGLLVAVQGLLVAIFGATTRQFRPVFPERVVTLGDVNVGVDQLLSFVVAMLITGGLAAFVARSRAGIAMRGVVDDADLLDLSGDNPAKVRRQAWALGSSVAALSGILIAPTLGLDPVLLTLLVVQAFGAAAIGRFTNIPRTFIGGLVVGVGAALATKYVGQFRLLGGFPSSLPFLVLFAVLLFTRRGRLLDLDTPDTSAPRASRTPLPPLARAVVGVAVTAAALLVPTFAGVRLGSYTTAVIFTLLFASLRLLVVTSGQVSLCHAAFAAVGATTFSHLLNGQGLPWLVALVLAGLVAIPVGAIVAVPAIRLSGLYLALATFGFGVLVQRLVFSTALMFGGRGSLKTGRPVIAGIDFAGDKAFYLLCVAIAAAGVALVHLLTRTRLGRLLRALADSPTALATLGNDVNLLRVFVFCVSAFLAAIAGALFAASIGTVGPTSFDAFLSLTLIVVLAISGRGELSAPIVAAAALVLVPSYVTGRAFNDWLPVLFGASAMLFAIGAPRDLAQRLHRGAERSRQRGDASPVRFRVAEAMTSR
jgi:ABC-type branched-subunit amino acid transport system permease subunit